MSRVFSARHAAQPLILFVEPMAHIRNRVAVAMKLTNMRLLAVENGKTALDIVQRVEMPTLAVIELALPDMKGVEVARRLYRYRPLPIIMTGYLPDPSAIVVMLDQIAEDFVQKPYDARELVARMLRLLPMNYRASLDTDAFVKGSLQEMSMQ